MSHRIIFSRKHCANVLINLIFVGFKESKQNSVEIKGLKGDAFRLVLEYIYTGNDVVSNDNVNDILLASSMLQISNLQELCQKFLDKNLSIENCIGYWRLSCLHEMKEYQPEFWQFLIKKFPTVVDCMEYLTLTTEELEMIIQDDDLNTPSEEFVCDMVMKWFKANENVDVEGLSRILEYLKFELMDDKFVRNLKLKYPEFEQNGSISRMIERKLLLKLDDQALDSSYRKEEIICMVGTRSRMPDPSKTEVQCYSYQDKKQFHLAPLPTEPGPCFAVCTLGNDIYISGGYNQDSLILHFNAKENSWDQHKCIVEGRWGHAMLAYNGYVYLIGGTTKAMDTLSSIEKFDPKTNLCTKIGHLEEAVSSVAVAVKGSKIYAFGGKRQDRQPSTLIQTFDINEGIADIVGEVPTAVKGDVGKAVSIGDDIYIVYRDGNILLIGEEENYDIVGFTKKFEHFGVIVKDNRILVIGCESNNFSTHIFDPALKQILSTPSEFKAPMCNFNLLKVVLSKKYLVQK